MADGAADDVADDAADDVAFVVSWMLPRGGAARDRLRRGTVPPVLFRAFCDVRAWAG